MNINNSHSTYTFKLIRKIYIGFMLFFLCSCKTLRIAEKDPFQIIGESADVYVFLPTAGNERFLTMILSGWMDKHDIRMALSRTKMLYAGVFTDETGPRQQEELLICALGKYPANMAGSIFKKKNGWTKYTAGKGIRYYSGGIAAVSIPNNQHLFLALSDAPELSMRFLLENKTNEAAVSFSDGFNRFVQDKSSGTMALFITNPNLFIAKAVGTDLQLPIKYSEIYLKKLKDEDSYSYSLLLETGNKRTAFALALILKNAVRAEIKTSGTTVFIENGTIREEELSDFLNTRVR